MRNLLLICSLLLAGCASKSYVVLLPSPDGTTGAIVVTGNKGQQFVNIKEQGVPLDGSVAPSPVDARRMTTDFSAALAAQPLLPVSFLVYFKFGGADLTPASTAYIATVLETTRQRGPSAVSVIGHTDTMGDSAWNQRVGLLRAQAIAAVLKANGLQVLELSVTSHGERNLMTLTPDGTSEPKNRCVEINIR